MAFLVLISSFVVQFMTGAFMNLNSVLLGVAAALVVLAVFFDSRLYWEFLTMRTTKHGLNMGAMILLVLTLLVCVNYLANKHNKTWDLTAEKLNSLSDQTTALLKDLKSDLEVKVFYKGPQAMEDKQKAKQTLSMYQDFSNKVKVTYINAYVEQQLAIQYLTDLQDRDSAPVITFLEYNGKKIRVEDGFDEAALTAAVIKATREGESKIYFVQGHGEKDLMSGDDQGLGEFAKALKESSFQTEPLNLMDSKEVPADAKAVAVIGPTVPLLENEVQALRAYAERGGRLFLALDPGVRHNLANLTKSLGVQFENNYIFSMLQIYGQGPATVIGRNFDPGSEITKNFPSGAKYAIFPLVSEVKAAADKSPSIDVKELVRSDERSFTMADPTKAPPVQPKTEMITVGLEAKGTIGKAKEGSVAKPFEAVIFGDSDFLSNRALFLGVNRDLAVNVLAGLTNQKDLLSIKPKLPKGTMLVLTQFSRAAIIVSLMSLPVLLLIASGVMWFRRRGA
jgi:ABC-type uncharacterized transport system involved in gliding motility auxiliary subunit